MEAGDQLGGVQLGCAGRAKGEGGGEVVSLGGGGSERASEWNLASVVCFLDVDLHALNEIGIVERAVNARELMLIHTLCLSRTDLLKQTGALLDHKRESLQANRLPPINWVPFKVL